MNKILEFFKANKIIVKWTIWYFFILWFILKFVFKFDMFSSHYWWKFFHATLRGFAGFVFGALVYSAIPVYIATTMIVHRKQELIIPIPFMEKISGIISKIFNKKAEQVEENKEPAPETKTEEDEELEFPSDLPHELRVPFKRAKNRMPLTSSISVYNQQSTTQKIAEPAQKTENESGNTDIPIPMDFDVSETIENDMNDSVPTFTDINFDIPIATEKELENKTTKYLKEKNIDYETYQDFIATSKFVIYEHNDEDFWIMDGDSWFATGKQKDSPIPELISLAKQNELTPVLYLASQNIMNIDATTANFESMGVHVIKDLDEIIS